MESVDNETWLLDFGDDVLTRAASGADLSGLDQLVRILWETDYCMRNAGDLANMEDLRPGFLAEGRALATTLGLPVAESLFTRTEEDFEREYLGRFDDVCRELRSVAR